MQDSREFRTFDDLLFFEDEKIRAVKLDIKLNVTVYRGGLGINRDNTSDIADSYIFANMLYCTCCRKDRSLVYFFIFFICTINVIIVHFIYAYFIIIKSN